MALKDFDQLSHEIDQAVHTNGPLGKTTAPGLNSVLKSLATELTNLPQAVIDEIPQTSNNTGAAGLEVVAVATLKGDVEPNSYFQLPIANSILDIRPSNFEGGWDRERNVYIVPISGIYEISAATRFIEGADNIGNMYSLGIGANEIRDNWFAWDTIVESKSGKRNTFQTTRITYLQQGDKVGTYIFCEEFNAYAEGEMSLKMLCRTTQYTEGVVLEG